jgi:hypothetical protein
MNLEDQQRVKCARGLVAGAWVQVHRLSHHRSSIGPFQSKIARKQAYESVNQVRFRPDVILARHR